MSRYYKTVALFILIMGMLPTLTMGQAAVDTIRVVNDLADREPTHTNRFGRIAGIAVPSLMVTYGIISLGSNGLREIDFNIQHRLQVNNSFLYNKADNYLQYSPAAAAFVLNLAGVKSRHKFSDMCIIYALSSILEAAVVLPTKQIVGRERPDISAATSFPSGHTATAFAAATFLSMEYGQHSVWISVGGYAMATVVGVSRIYNNKHWLSDVVAGAGIGILSTEAIYWVYPWLRGIFRPKDRYAHTLVFPGYNNRNLTLNLSCTF